MNFSPFIDFYFFVFSLHLLRIVHICYIYCIINEEFICVELNTQQIQKKQAICALEELFIWSFVVVQDMFMDLKIRKTERKKEREIRIKLKG